jgi:hypothetical protein
MEAPRKLLTRRTILISLAVLGAGLALGAYFTLRRLPREPMERYIPATALAYAQLDSLPELLDGLTSTPAWRELAPALGLSSQLKQVGSMADLMGRAGIGPDEAVVAGRAQFAIAITGIDAETGSEEEGPYVRFKPRLALIVQSHASPETAARLVRDRASIVAARLFGGSIDQQSRNYQGVDLLIFRGSEPQRQLMASATGSLLVLTNDETAMTSCLDTIAGRAPGLTENATLRDMRKSVGDEAPVFAFVTATGVARLAQLAPALVASRFTTDPERIGAVASLFGHLSEQAIAGLLYSSSSRSGGVVDKYMTVLAPPVASDMAALFKPGNDGRLESLSLGPRSADDFTLLDLQGAGDLPERGLKQLAPKFDVVAGLALKEFVIGLRSRLGLRSEDWLGGAVSNDITLIKLADDQPVAMLIGVKDRNALMPVVDRYLRLGGAAVLPGVFEDVVVLSSSNPDGRAAAFVDNYLVLGTRDQMPLLIDARGSRSAAASDERIVRALRDCPASASMISCRPGVDDAGELMLTISKLTRVTDGSRELLASGPVRAALGRLPPSVSFTEFRDSGVYTETRSAAGNFTLLASLFGSGED